MKFIANEYETKEILKMLREWCELSQDDFSRSIGKKGRGWAKAIERGVSRCYFDDILKIAKEFDIKITFEKK